MTHIPKLSVLITSYNDSKFISQCLDSILNQTFQDFEIIIVDDGSKDNTVEIIKSYQKKDSRINLICNEKNMGLAKSLNKGLQYCHAELIARQDADDYSLPTRFAEQLEYLKKYPEAVLLGTQRICVDEKNSEVKSDIYYPTDNETIKKILNNKNCFNHSAVIFIKQAILNVGGYRPFPASQDYDLWVRVAQYHMVLNMDRQLVCQRLTRNSISFNNIEVQTATSNIISKLAKQRLIYFHDELHELKGEKLEKRIWNLIKKELKKNKKLNASKNVYLFEYILKMSGRREAFIYIFCALKQDPFNKYIIRLFWDTYIFPKTSALTK